MVKRQMFTDPFIRALKAKRTSYKLSEHAPRGEGRLIVRVLPNGTKEFFYRYRPNGEDKTLMLGRYDQTGRNGKTLAGIRKALRDRRELQRETGDVKEHLKLQARKLDVERRRGSLGQLLDAYVAHLRAEGKAESASDAENIFKNHVTKAFPAIANSKANEVTADDTKTILAKMVGAGITRQVNKARSYLRAAFGYGLAADHDPRRTSGSGEVLFGLKGIPIASKPIREFERTLERALSEAELREYWKGLDKLPRIQAATLRFNLALACQRPTQLLRADWSAFDLSANTLLLRDPKGRGGSRDHLLPLPAFALEQLKPLRQINGGAPGPFSSDGKRRLAVDTLTRAVAEVSAKLEKRKIQPFQQRDLRRTAETMLQKMGIDREIRAHLLSHGRTQGVQGKHYERYDFLPEKRAALEKWARNLQRIIEGKAAKVVPLRGRRAA